MKKYYCPCKSGSLKEAIVFKEKPKGETDFGIKRSDYYRFYETCLNCKHWFSVISPKIKLITVFTYSLVVSSFNL